MNRLGEAPDRYEYPDGGWGFLPYTGVIVSGGGGVLIDPVSTPRTSVTQRVNVNDPTGKVWPVGVVVTGGASPGGTRVTSSPLVPLWSDDPAPPALTQPGVADKPSGVGWILGALALLAATQS